MFGSAAFDLESAKHATSRVQAFRREILILTRGARFGYSDAMDMDAQERLDWYAELGELLADADK